MLDSLPLWLRVPIITAIGIGVVWMLAANLRGFWQREQIRKAATAPPAVPGTAPTPRSGRDLLLLVGAAVALVLIANASQLVANANIRRGAMAAVIVLVAARQWHSRRKAKREANAQQYPPYQPYQGT